MCISLIIQIFLIDTESILQILYDTHMKITTSYSVAFKDGYDAIKKTTVIYNESVRYLIDVVQQHWDEIEKIDQSKLRMNYVERLVHTQRTIMLCMILMLHFQSILPISEEVQS